VRNAAAVPSTNIPTVNVNSNCVAQMRRQLRKCVLLRALRHSSHMLV
jgi:hypothetical protein